MKNNKGITLVEIIVSVVLISIVVIFIFNLMVTVKNINDNSNTSLNNIINKNIIIEKVQADFNEKKLVGVANCTDTDKSDLMVSNYDKDTAYCIKFNYETGVTGHLVYYSYEKENEGKLNIIGYVNGNNKTLRQSTIAPVKNDNINVEIKSSCKDEKHEKCALNIILPVYEMIGSSYDINLNYINSHDVSISYLK